MSGYRYLTARDLANMTPAMLERRRANWRTILRELERQHEQMFHSKVHVDQMLRALGVGVKRDCSYEGCEADYYAKGLCERHYRRQRHHLRKAAA